MKSPCKYLPLIIPLLFKTILCCSQAIDLPDKLRGALLLSAEHQKIELNQEIFEFFSRMWQISSTKMIGRVDTISADELVKRLDQYFIAKKFLAGREHLKPSDLRDFTWPDIFAGSRWISIQIPDSLKLLKLQVGEDLRNFESISDLDWLAVPAVDFTVQTIFVNNVLIVQHYSGVPPSGEVQLAAAPPQGCEIYVNSVPQKASVYFNSKKYHRDTNTSSVRDHGTWEVRIEKEGYETWTKTKTLGRGDVWNINAPLKMKQ